MDKFNWQRQGATGQSSDPNRRIQHRLETRAQPEGGRENYRRELRQSAASHRRSRQRKRGGCMGALLYLIIVVAVSILLSLLAVLVANDVFAFVKDDAEISISVPENTDVMSMADQLDKAGVVNYGTMFKIYLRIKKDNQDVLAGTYRLNPTMDYGQIVSALANVSTNETMTITIPEGYSVAQVRQLLLDAHVCTEDTLDEVLSSYPFKHTFLQDKLPAKSGWLEGYLFPDTYEIYKGNATVVDTINKMLNNFDTKYDQEIAAGAAEQGRTMEEIVIVASLVEREAKAAEDYARIAGVIYNRLRAPESFPYLQLDASVLYGLGRVGGALTQQDLDIDTPYNLYLHQGLPPGAICNPGYRALYAAAYPESHRYYYYVAMPDGTSLFANSYDEHQANINRSNQAQAAAAVQTGG